MQSTLRDILSVALPLHKNKTAQMLIECATATSAGTNHNQTTKTDFIFKHPSPSDSNELDRDNNNSECAIDLSSPQPTHSAKDHHSSNGSSYRQSVIRSGNSSNSTSSSNGSSGFINMKKHAIATYNLHHSPQNGGKGSPRMSGKCDTC